MGRLAKAAECAKPRLQKENGARLNIEEPLYRNVTLHREGCVGVRRCGGVMHEDMEVWMHGGVEVRR